ncbi:hypothetical protein FRC01_003220 [Tulasnella sp. 417]|nr:hypothetical protein FRC01_003220 [Tulasnella sp. 417]
MNPPPPQPPPPSPPPPQEPANQVPAFQLIHTSGTDRIRALGALNCGKCRWYTLILRPAPDANDQATITAELVRRILAPKATNDRGFSILGDNATGIILIVFHSKKSYENAQKIVTNATSRLFRFFDVARLSELEPEEVRNGVDCRLGNYLKSVQNGNGPAHPTGPANDAPSQAADSTANMLPDATISATNVHLATLAPETVASSTAPTPVRPGSGPPQNPRSEGPLSRETNDEGDASTESRNWRDANFHIRDVVNNVTLVHQRLRDSPTIAPVLDEAWKPSTRDVGSDVKEAFQSLMKGLPDPSDAPQIPAQLATAMTQAAALCGIEFCLDVLNIDDASDGEEQVVN